MSKIGTYMVQSIPSSGEQIRAARSALGWSASYLADAAGVASKTVNRLEAQGELIGTSLRTLRTLSDCLQKAGIEFIESNDDAKGILLRTSPD